MTAGHFETVDTTREFRLGGGVHLTAQSWPLIAFSH